MGDLSAFVENPETVTAVLGEWPSFHDAELLSLELKRNGVVSATITIKAKPYSPEGKSVHSLIKIVFEGISSFRLVDFNEQNSMYSLDVTSNGDKKVLKIDASYGAEAAFAFEQARVLNVERL
jgi:hypothetical protein